MLVRLPADHPTRRPIEAPDEVIERLCHLIEVVNREHFGFSVASDCICRTGGSWRPDYDPVARGSWRFYPDVLVFIEEAVNARLVSERPVRFVRRLARALRYAWREGL